MKTICLEPGCASFSHAQGYCQIHYQGLKRKGTLRNLPKPEKKIIQGEIWKRIKKYPRYMVSNMGRVKSDMNGILTPQWSHKDKKHKLHLGVGVCLPVAKLVAGAFIPNPYNEKKLKFLDGDRRNCRADNLDYYGHHYFPISLETLRALGATDIVAYMETGDKNKIKPLIERQVCRLYEIINSIPYAFIDTDKVVNKVIVRALSAIQRGLLHDLSHVNGWFYTIAKNVVSHEMQRYRGLENHSLHISQFQTTDKGVEQDWTDLYAYKQWEEEQNCCSEN